MNYFAANLKRVVQRSRNWSDNCLKISFTVDLVAKIKESAWLIRKSLTFYLQTEQLCVVGKGVWGYDL